MEMAFRSKTLCLMLWLSVAGQAQFSYEVRQPRAPQRDRVGKLVIDDKGVTFEETKRKPKHQPFRLNLTYVDVEQLAVSRDSLTVVSYADSKWKLGADRTYRFDRPKGATFEPVYEYLKNKLDQRFVAAIADSESRSAEWQIPAKHLRGAFGSQGVLVFGPDWIAFSTAAKERSRTWRYADIENVSSAGPYDFTITTFERSRIHYNGHRDFSFQLKERLDEAKYEQLWLRLNDGKQLNVLNLYKKER
jgi:hypothetical protein